jgi:hypothetical protein
MERLSPTFQFEARGLIDVKGKGPTPTYFLTGRIPEARDVRSVVAGTSSAG